MLRPDPRSRQTPSPCPRSRRRGAGVDSAELGGARPRPQRSGVPAGVPADRQPADAEDLTQDVFVRVFRSLHRFQPGTFEGWLHRITTNLFLDGARRRQKIRFDGLVDGSADRLPSQLAHPVGAAGRRRPRSRCRRRPGRPVAGVSGRGRALRYRGSQLRGDQRGARRQDRHRAQPDPPRPGPAPGRPRPPAADRSPRSRYLGVEVEVGRPTPRSDVRRSGASEAIVRKAPCAELAELRSAYVDGALERRRPGATAGPPGGLCRMPRGRRGHACRPRAVDPDAGGARAGGSRPVPPAGVHRRRRTLSSRCGPGRSGGRRRRSVQSACPAVGGSAGFEGRGGRRGGRYAAGRGRRGRVRGRAVGPARSGRAIPVGERRRPSAPASRQFPLSGDTLGAVMLADAADAGRQPGGPRPRTFAGVSVKALDPGQARQRHAARRRDRRRAELLRGCSRSTARSGRPDHGRRASRSRRGPARAARSGSAAGPVSQLLGGFSPAGSTRSRVVDDELADAARTQLRADRGIDGGARRRAPGHDGGRLPAGRVAARWWLDDEHGAGALAGDLRRQGRHRAVLRLHLRSRSAPAAEMHGPSAAPAGGLARTTTSLTTSNATGLAPSGWSCRRQLAGLSLVRLRSDGRRPSTRGPPGLQRRR